MLGVKKVLDERQFLQLVCFQTITFELWIGLGISLGIWSGVVGFK